MLLSTPASSIGHCFAIAIVLSSFLDLVSAQSFDPSSVDLSTKQAWCLAQIHTCQVVCLSAGTNVTNDENTCDTSTLDTSCTCLNGFAPPLSRYTGTITYFECQQVFANCISANANDVAAQNTCKQENDAFCAGSTSITTIGGQQLTLVGVPAASTSSASSTFTSSGATITRSSSSTSSLPTSTSDTPTTSPSNTDPSSNNAHGSSHTAVAIAVPVVVVVLLILGGIVFFIWRRRRAASKNAALEAGTPSAFEKAELHGEAVQPTEMPVQERFEMDGTGWVRPEMGAEEVPHEMGTGTGTNLGGNVGRTNRREMEDRP